MLPFPKRFPVQIVLAALFIYVVTISHGVTLSSLPLTAKLAGWDWQPMLNHPLLWLLTLPMRLLPAGWIAPALNFFFATLAALVLGILVRSLELIDPGTLSEALGWRAKLPGLLACVVCGMEFNFWREATAGTGEMLQLLLLVSAIWCLLEYRANRTLAWMQAATFIWGLGLTENWMMMLTLPLFMGSLFWLGGWKMFSVRMILRLTLTGLAGFSILFLQPLAIGLWPHSSLGPGKTFVVTLEGFKGVFGNLHYEFWEAHRLVSFVVVLFFAGLLILTVISRRRQALGNKRPLDIFIDKQVFTAQLVLGLLFCAWLAFDPVPGPRQIVLQQTGVWLPMLSLDYLGALCTGYLAGNLMTVLRQRRRGSRETFFRRAAFPVFITFLVLVAAGLILRNVPAILLVNRQPFTEYGELARRSLPAGGGIVLSDEPRLSMAFQAAAASHGDRRWLVVDTPMLPSVAYREHLSREYAGDWLTRPGRGELSDLGTVTLLEQFAQTHHIYYLHESYGYLFEAFYLEPVGPVFEMKVFAREAIDPPPLSDAVIAATEQSWNDAAPQIEEIKQTLAPSNSAAAWLTGYIYTWLHLQSVPPEQSQLLAESYSVALNDWGVRLQRAGRLAAAHKRFVQSLELNPDNDAARINLGCNTNLVTGRKMNLAGVQTLAGKLGDARNYNQFILGSGMADGPSFCYLLGTVFVAQGLPREAIQQFERVNTLAPNVAAPELVLAELYAKFGFDEQARQMIERIRNGESSLAERNYLEPELSVLEAETWFSQTNKAGANGVLKSLLKKHPDETRAQNLAMRAYMSFGDYTNALLLANARIAADPGDVRPLLNQAAIYRRLGAFTHSIASFDHALALTNLPAIHIMRDEVYVEAGELDAAESDYLEMDKIATNHLAIYFGLAEIADRRHDTDGAIGWLERCLAEVPAGSAQYQMLTNNIEALRSTDVSGE